MEAYFESWWWLNVINPSTLLFVFGLIVSLCFGVMVKSTAYTIYDNYTWRLSDDPRKFSKPKWWQHLIGVVAALLCLFFFWPIVAVVCTIIIAAGIASG